MPQTSALAALIFWGVTGVAGLALFAVYFAVRRGRRRRGRVWSVPLGGYFPLTAVVGSAGVLVGMLLLLAAHVEGGAWSIIIVLAAAGLIVTYGLRMWRMLWNQARGRNELA